MADSFSTDIPKNDDYLSDDLYDNSTYDVEHSIWDRPETSALVAVLPIIFVVGLIGNATLIFIVLRNKPMRTKANVLIVNLAIGDFIFILFSVPFTLVFFILFEWPFGSAICKLNFFMETLSLGVSIFTLVALSVDRFIAVVYPLTSYSSQSLTRVVIASVVIWVMSTGLALMDLVAAHTITFLHGHRQITICYLHPEEWGEGYLKFRVIFHCVVYFAVPVIVIVCLYVIIAVVLLRQSFSPNSQMGINASSSSSAPSESSQPRLRQPWESVAMVKQNESRKKTVKIVLSFVVIFIVCWLPHQLLAMCVLFLDDFEWNMGWHAMGVVSLCLIYIYSAINPLALYLLNAEYKRYFHHYLFGCCYKPWRLTNNETVSDVIGLQRMITATNASLEDDNQNGAEISLSTLL